MKVGVGTMQGYAFIDQNSMRAAPGEAERAGKARCEARWGPWVGHWWEEECERKGLSRARIKGRDVGL